LVVASSATRRKGGDKKCIICIYYEAYINKKDAQEAERFYKTGYGREVLNGKLKHFLVS